MQKHCNLFVEAIRSLLRNRGRSGVVLFCLLGVLLPFVTAMAVAQGVRYQSSFSINSGADLYIAREQYGRNGPVSLQLIKKIENLSGVTRVVPRIVGRTYLGEDLVVVVGVDEMKTLPGLNTMAPGPGQAFVGKSLAEKADLAKGNEFHFGLFPALPFTVVQLLSPALSLWSSSMIVINFHDAEQLFKRPGYASELLVYCRPGTADSIAERLSSIGKPWEMVPPLRIQTKKLVKQYVGRGFDIQSGLFAMLYVTAFGLAIPALLILSGFGRGIRRREIGILKATGWQTLDVLEVTCMENLFLALTGSSLAILLAVIWLKLCNGIGIAPLFISGSGWIPDFPIPARFMPMPALLSFLFGLSLTMVGTIIPTWRAAVTPPLTTMN
ncbi:MAG TPA: ABC transporter permease [Desulfobulbaceae bacterium]|nr:ABC transporter permease [Desulfobulbaceae bacterium]